MDTNGPDGLLWATAGMVMAPSWPTTIFRSASASFAGSTFCFSFGSFASPSSWPSGPNETAVAASATVW